MNLSVRLAGTERIWRFRDSARLENWLINRPWTSPRAHLACRVGDNAATTDWPATLKRQIVGHDLGGTNVRVEIISQTRACKNVWEAIGTHIEVSPGGDETVLRRSVLDYLRQSPGPLVLLLQHASDGTNLDWFAAGARFLDELSLLVGLPHVSLVVIGERPTQNDLCFDLRCGLPVGGLLLDADSAPDKRWEVYTHLRLAWESGGSIERARRFEQECAPQLDPGKTSVSGVSYPHYECAFENALNRCAAAEWKLVGKQFDAALEHFLEANLRRGKCQFPPEMEFDLVDRGILWKPPAEARSRPAPWVARAVLHTNLPLAQRWTLILRNCLVCTPIEQELLARCLAHEPFVKDTILNGKVKALPPDEFSKRLAEYCDRSPDDVLAYPFGHPSPPADEWAFSSLGGFLFAFDRKKTDHPIPWRIANLRNSIAHGHYVCWRSILEICAIEEKMALYA